MLASLYDNLLSLTRDGSNADLEGFLLEVTISMLLLWPLPPPFRLSVLPPSAFPRSGHKQEVAGPPLFYAISTSYLRRLNSGS